MSLPDATVVRACLRDGAGGSPTAVVLEDGTAGPPPDADAGRRTASARGTSHAVLVRRTGDTTELRFFTAEGELSACGHGTVAALALLMSRYDGTGPRRATLRAGGRVFAGRAERDGELITAAFDPGPVGLREPTAAERALVLPALGLAPHETGPDVRIAGLGRERVLVPVRTRAALTALRPDLDRLRAVCDRFGLLGAYVHSEPTPEGRLAARMFAPSIGVPEDIANANGTACLAASLAGRGIRRIAVDMGDALGSPATVTATAGPDLRVEVGGTARVHAEQHHQMSSNGR
ncbi:MULTISPECIES: PhzF family phenazine biosynthesis protein [unclassified Streptomyces]|uniref:PhzF family phenazine biosynthesis protein n=1 Tax=unclassified Streptomyces TaxID=2593676 RepID=UPI002238D59C|nr:PhzF family phenazine biosynthesis protein [Streptomyces sp. SHP 1-2]MCW5250352.1 PhzF family phenazine biosynthesis protein [Streptomyces sp. SHP 1-2]